MANLEKRYTDDEIIAALRHTGGDVYGAAARLGCSPSTISKRKHATPRIAEAIEAIRGETRFGLVSIAYKQAIAKAEIGDTSDLYKLINRIDIQLDDGNAKPLEHRHEHTGPGGGSIQVVLVEDWYGTQGGALPVRPESDGSSAGSAAE